MIAMLTDTDTATIPTLEAFDPRAELDAWDACIAELDRALRDAAEARLDLDALAVTLDRLEAGHALSIEGGNAESRKARLTLAMADDGRYERARLAQQDARRCLLDAERRAELARQRCRLLRAALSIADD